MNCFNFFKEGQNLIKKISKEHGRNPNTLEFPILVFPEVSETDLDDDRLPLNGSIAQIALDIKEYEKLGVNHINLSFDFGTISQDLEKRLSYAKQIRDLL